MVNKFEMLECQHHSDCRSCVSCSDRFVCHTMKGIRFVIREHFSGWRDYEIYTESEDEALDCYYDGEEIDSREDSIKELEVIERE